MSVAVVTGAGRGFGREIAKRLVGRSLAVLCTDVDEAAARETADAIGGGSWAMALDVRDPEAHRRVAAAASERGRLSVWVNNAGVLRTDPAWVHSDDDVRLTVETNVLGVIYGSRAAVEVMRENAHGDGHLINIGSMSAYGPVPGLAVYAASKHAVLGFSTSLQGDLSLAGLPIHVHVICPDGADTQMLREHDTDPDAAIIWSGPRLLSAEEVAEQTVALLDSGKLVKGVPRNRAVQVRILGLMPRVGLRLASALRKHGERKRRKALE